MTLQEESDERARFYRMSCCDDRWPALQKKFAKPKFLWEIEVWSPYRKRDLELIGGDDAVKES